MQSIFHKGEIKIQEKAGERTIGERTGRAINKKIIPVAIQFIEQQPFCLISSKDQSGETAVSALAGKEGYVKVKNEEALEIFPGLLTSNPFDVFYKNIKIHKKVGMMFLEPETRRRFRINGRVEIEKDRFFIRVDQAYSNCPKYIQKRQLKILSNPQYYEEFLQGTSLTPGISNIIRQADTLFVGSSSPEGDMDVSHRGGLPGFITISNNDTLVIPDYQGNSMYNTLGNIEHNPHAGILIQDFRNKNSLQLSGTAKVFFNGEDEKITTGGTSRYWTFKVSKWKLSENLKGIDWNLMEYSPFNPS